MSSFKFNFSGDSNESDKQQKDEAKEEIQWLESEQVIPVNQIINLDNIVIHANIFMCGNIEIGHVIPKEALHSMRDIGLNHAELAEKEHSDLVAGKYEGGLKIWECTYDLIKYLLDEDIGLKNMKVLDLGCGAGILGIYAFMNGSHLTFQDYNKEVIEYVTIPNVLLNIEEEDRKSEITKCKFFSGDWASFNKNLTDTDIYDVILTSETIYNPCNYDKLIELFVQRLKKDGSVYLAAKTYYFGVGGGTRQFESSIKKNGLLKCEVCWKNSDGIQREILKITRV